MSRTARSKEKFSPRTEIAHTLLCYAAIGALIFLAIGMKNLENYHDWAGLCMLTMAAGAVCGVVFFAALSRIVPPVGTYLNSKGMGFFTPTIWIFVMVFFGVGRLVNEASDRSIDCDAYTIQRLGASGSRARAYYVFIDNHGTTERLSFGRDFNEAHHPGDTIHLCLITGALGFRYFKLNKQLQQ